MEAAVLNKKYMSMKNKSLLLTLIILIIAMSSFAQVTGNVADSRDGKIYKTVQIESQTWMAENLNFKTNESWCYKYDSSKCAIYGRLYTWDAAKNACPSGWHLPSYDEWITLVNNLGGEKVAGGKMKESGTSHWTSPNKGATNTSGFNALPGGYRNYEIGIFMYIGYNADWWSSSEINSVYALGLGLNKYSGSMNNGTDPSFKKEGLSIRCLKD
jgi:uncharacterized protein (TIGR02145 family)